MDRELQLKRVLYALAGVIKDWNDLAEDDDRGRNNAGLCLTLFEDGSGRLGNFHEYDSEAGTFAQLTANVHLRFDTIDELVAYLLDWVPDIFEVPE